MNVTEMSRTRRAIYTFSAQSLYIGATTLLGLFATPLLLRWLGDTKLGAFRAMSDAFGVLQLLELGLGAALNVRFSRALGRGDRCDVVRVLAAGIAAYAGVALAVLLAWGAASLAVERLVPVPTDVLPDLRLTAAIALLTPLALPFTPFRILIEVDQRGYFNQAVIIAQNLLFTTLGLVLAQRTGTIAGQYVAFLVGLGLSVGLVAAFGLRRYPEVFAALADRGGWTSVGRELWSINVTTSLWVLMGKIAALDTLVLSTLVGPSSVVTFVMTQRLILVAGGFCGAVGRSTWASFADLHFRRPDLLPARITEVGAITSVLSAALLLPVAIFNGFFVDLWVGADRYGGGGLTMLTTVNALSGTLILPWTMLFLTTGRLRVLLTTTAVSSVVTLGTSIVATMYLGTIGPAVGSLAGSVFVLAWSMPLLLRREFQVPLWPLFSKIARPWIFGIPAAAGVAALVRERPPATLLELLIALTAFFFVLGGLLARIALSADDRRSLYARLSAALWPRRPAHGV